MPSARVIMVTGGWGYEGNATEELVVATTQLPSVLNVPDHEYPSGHSANWVGKALQGVSVSFEVCGAKRRSILTSRWLKLVLIWYR
jgi:hypothetical protein